MSVIMQGTKCGRFAAVSALRKTEEIIGAGK